MRVGDSKRVREREKTEGLADFVLRAKEDGVPSLESAYHARDGAVVQARNDNLAGSPFGTLELG